MNKIIKIFKKIILRSACLPDKCNWVTDEKSVLHTTRKCSKCNNKEYYNSYYKKWKKMF